MFIYYPPARSNLFFCKSIFHLLFRCKDPNKTLQEIFGDKKIFIHGDSWVNLLALLLKKLNNNNDLKNQVILPRYSCYEFTKSIIKAGLKPVYIDVNSDFTINLLELNSKIDKYTLAIIAVFNVGIESNSEKLKRIASDHHVHIIEDATYTFLGKNIRNEYYGYLFDFAILNFSEGKAIPVGGGGLLIDKKCVELIDSINVDIIVNNNCVNNLKDIISLIRYKFGSSVLGYTIYKIIRIILKVDLKRKLSMEPTRSVAFDMSSNQKVLEIKELSMVKQQFFSTVLLNYNHDSIKRFAKYRFVYDSLKSLNNVFDFYPDQFVIRIPLIVDSFPEDKLKQLRELGVVSLYSITSPLYRNSMEFPNSKKFYESLLTIPVYSGISYKLLKRIINILESEV